MIAAGIDAGTESYELLAIKNDKPSFKATLPTSEVRKNPKLLFEIILDSKADIIAGISGYGLPVKKFSEISDKEVFLMTLNREESIIGLRLLIELARESDLNIYTIPAVIHLPSVPRWRKLNKVDMGTSDKLCSVALALYQLSREVSYEEQNFVLVEAGFGFNAFIAVEGGKVVDGIGGTSGFPSFSSLGSINGELAYLLSGFPKSMLFGGGIRSFLRDAGKEVERIEELPEEAAEWFCEFVMKGVGALRAKGKERMLIISGRFFEVSEFKRLFIEKAEDYEVLKLKGFGLAKQSAEGAAIIANGLAGKEFEGIVEHLEIRKAGGTILDYITSDVRKHIRLDF